MRADDLGIANGCADNRMTPRDPDFFGLDQQHPTTTRLFARDRPGSAPDRPGEPRSAPDRPGMAGIAEIDVWGLY